MPLDLAIRVLENALHFAYEHGIDSIFCNVCLTKPHLEISFCCVASIVK